MRQVWQTFDGQVFENHKEALEHEKNFLICDGIEMYDHNGEKMNFMLPCDAFIIRINKNIDENKLEKWKDDFLKLDDTGWAGTGANKAIENAYPGEFIYWDDITEEYHTIPDYIQKIIFRNDLL